MIDRKQLADLIRETILNHSNDCTMLVVARAVNINWKRIAPLFCQMRDQGILRGDKASHDVPQRWSVIDKEKQFVPGTPIDIVKPVDFGQMMAGRKFEDDPRPVADRWL